MSKTLDMELFDPESLEEESEKVEEETTMPAYGSKEWNDYG